MARMLEVKIKYLLLAFRPFMPHSPGWAPVRRLCARGICPTAATVPFPTRRQGIGGAECPPTLTMADRGSLSKT